MGGGKDELMLPEAIVTVADFSRTSRAGYHMIVRVDDGERVVVGPRTSKG